MAFTLAPITLVLGVPLVCPLVESLLSPIAVRKLTHTSLQMQDQAARPMASTDRQDASRSFQIWMINPSKPG